VSKTTTAWPATTSDQRALPRIHEFLRIDPMQSFLRPRAENSSSHLRSANPWTTDNSDNTDICIRRIRVISDIRGQTLRPFAMVAPATG
jgi:hypothetical protein